ARHRVGGSDADHARRAQGVRPGGIEQHFGARLVQDLEHLLAISGRVGGDLVPGKRGSCRVLAGRIADHAGKIADQELNVMAQVLKLPQFVDDHGVAKVQVGGGGVHAQFYAQRTAQLELVDQFGFHEQLVTAAPHHLQLLVDVQNIFKLKT